MESSEIGKKVLTDGLDLYKLHYLKIFKNSTYPVYTLDLSAKLIQAKYESTTACLLLFYIGYDILQVGPGKKI